MTFNERIRTIQKRKRSLLCVGLDPDIAKIPPFLRRRPNAILEFNKRIISATSDLVCAYKLNLAFYEAHGKQGWAALEKTLELIPGSILKIGDGKRGDIGNTAEMYARALFDGLGFDAVTVNPYMGTDSVMPFLENPKKGAFILALTSNPGAKEFQNLKSGGRPLHEHVIAAARRWSGRENCGLVIGATRPAELKRLRPLAPQLPFLIPGIGAQGGDLRAAVRHGCTADGDLAIINVGRSILYASQGKDFDADARREAGNIRATMEEYRNMYFS